ncbi:hypothetical protein [Kitasatospora sp. NPDC097643]|uniref:hypothetical protein n=1 Tax=Kitasatospora sp. NPDC097643 TaxID=3157230 RepID=UPI0033330022
MRDPLEWRAGDGPMADWLSWVDEQLVGPQPAGYRLWGPGPGDYPEVIGTGLDPAGLADRLAAAGVGALHIRTSGGETIDRPHVVIAKPPEREFDTSILRAEPTGAPAGRARIATRVRTHADLGRWLASWSPLVPGGIPGFVWPDDTLATPLALTHEHWRGPGRLVLRDLAAVEEGRGPAATRQPEQRPGPAGDRVRQRVPRLTAAADRSERGPAGR